MTLIEGLAIRVFAVGALMLSAAQSQTGNLEISGQWSLTSVQAPNKVQLTLHWKSGKHSVNSTTEWLLDRIEGLSGEQLKSPGTAVQFQIKREAGTLNCEGFLKKGSGGGVFSFVVNRGFVDAMSGLGFSGLRDDQVFAMAVHDVTTSYVKSIRAEGISISGVDQLIGMKIHGVEVAYVREMKGLGLSGLSADKLMGMRIHGVTPELARDMKHLGYSSLTTDQLVAMRIHGASVEFVRQLDKLGYKQPSIDQLLAMRIHRVTPELIQKLQQRGMKDLSIDRLISLRIHGIVN